MRKHYASKAEFKTLLPTNKNRRSGKKERDFERGWLGDVKAALKLWEIRQEYPHLGRAS